MYKRLFVYCLLAGIMVGCTVAAPESSPTITPTKIEQLPVPTVIAASDTVEDTTNWPTTDWQTSTPEEQGLDPSLIADMLQAISDQGLEIDSVLIVRHGYLVTEVYYPPYTQSSKHPIYSISKSVTSTMIGIAIREGYIQSVQQPVLDFFPEITADDYLKELTIEHLLTMSAGYGTRTIPDLNSRKAKRGTIDYILTKNQIVTPPGTSFYYDGGMPHLLSAIIQKTTGSTLEAYARSKLFEPMGISDITWEADPQGITLGHTGLNIRPRDMAKFGYLYLQHGQWDGEQLVPETWIDAATTKQIETKGLMNAAEDDGYGYLWWIDSFGGYSAHGYAGQYIFVLPDLDMVVVFTAQLKEADFPAPHSLLKSYLIPAADN